MMQRYYTVMSKCREIAVDLLNKMIINSRALIKAKEKEPA